MLRYYDPVDARDLARMEKRLTAAGIEYAVTPPRPESTLPGAIGIAEEDVPRVEELLTTHTRRH